MKYYIKNGEVFGFDVSQSKLITKDMIPCVLQSDGKPYPFYNADGTPDTKKFERVKREEERSREILEAKEYLNNTDWYVTRKIETGKEIPHDVSEKRQFYRDIITGE